MVIAGVAARAGAPPATWAARAMPVATAAMVIRSHALTRGVMLSGPGVNHGSFGQNVCAMRLRAGLGAQPAAAGDPDLVLHAIWDGVSYTATGRQPRVPAKDRPPASATAVTRVTHSCHLIEIGGRTILTDPWFAAKPGFTTRASRSPWTWTGCPTSTRC
jgi:hypothetical protein